MEGLLNEIDELLAHFEDFTHGKDGEDITKMRCRIAIALRQYNVNQYKKQVTEQYEKMKIDLDKKEFTHLILDENTHIYNSGLSVKILNILVWAKVEKLGDLKTFKKKDLLRFRGLGKKCFNEIEKCLLQAGIVLVE